MSLCNVVAGVLDARNIIKFKKKLIKKALENVAAGIDARIDLVRLAIDAQYIKLLSKINEIVPLSTIKNAVSLINKAADFQDAVKRGDAAGAARIAEEIAEDFGIDVNNILDIPVCDLDNLMKTSGGVLKIGTAIKAPTIGIPLLDALIDASESLVTTTEDFKNKVEEAEDSARKRNKEALIQLKRDVVLRTPNKYGIKPIVVTTVKRNEAVTIV